MFIRCYAARRIDNPKMGYEGACAAVGMPLAPDQRLDLACNHRLIRLRVGMQTFTFRNSYDGATTDAINLVTEDIVIVLKTYQFHLAPAVAAFAAELQTCQCVAPGKRTILMLKYIASSRDIFGCSKNRQNRIVENSTYPLDDFGFR